MTSYYLGHLGIPLLFSTEIEILKLIENHDNAQVKVLANGILEHFRRRFQKFSSLANCTEVNNAILATCSHPKYKLQCFKEAEDFNIKNLLKAACLAEVSRDLIGVTSNMPKSSELPNDGSGKQLLPHVSDNLNLGVE